jgi:hypothetical protein
MPSLKSCWLPWLLASFAATAVAGPDEDRLGKAQGYPAGTANTWFHDEAVRVGSFTSQGEIPGMFNVTANVLAASATPLTLARSEREPPIRWDVGRFKNLTVDDYLARQRIMGLMVSKDGVVQVERYQYGRTASQRRRSHSMAKSIVSLAVGIARHAVWRNDDLERRGRAVIGGGAADHGARCVARHALFLRQRNRTSWPRKRRRCGGPTRPASSALPAISTPRWAISGAWACCWPTPPPRPAAPRW